MRKAIESNAKILALFAVACTLVVGLVNVLTKDRIELQQQQQLLTTLSSIIEPSRHNNNIYLDCIRLQSPELANNEEQIAYLAKWDDTPIAMAITTTAPDGYNGNIDLLVAINVDGSVSGVRVLKHKETPGLGDKIELRKSNWINSFTKKIMTSDNDNRWHVVKDGGMFDQFTGATITPRAIVKAVKETVIYFNKNQQALFAKTSTCRGEQ
ncbi:MAG: electron transport complex subunit RsxG [Colwellia sp.]|nr:electron transport complex subunit RsxG [Colwellia sp.]